jgi:hypothetical protein
MRRIAKTPTAANVLIMLEMRFKLVLLAEVFQRAAKIGHSMATSGECLR